MRDLLKSADNTDAYSGVDCASLSFLNTVCHGDGMALHERRKNNSAGGGMPAGNGAAIDCTPPECLLPSRYSRYLLGQKHAENYVEITYIVTANKF